MATKTETRKIRVEIKGTGSGELKKIAKGFSSISKSSKKTASILSRFDKVFKSIFLGSLAGVGIRNITKTADSLQLLRDRIKVFEGESADATFTKLGQAATFTRTSVENLAESYSRVALATKDLGLSSDAILGVTTALQQTFRLSGSTLAEASAATIQLTQGLASGAVRGQELRSVLEANAVFGGLLAKEFGKTRGELIKFGETGKITSSKVLKVLADNFNELNKDAGKLGITFEQVVIVNLNRLKIAFADLNKEINLSGAFSKSVTFLIENFKLIAQATIFLLGVNYLPALGIMIGVTLTKAVTLASTAFLGLYSVMLGGSGGFLTLIAAINPVSASVVVLSAAIAHFATNWEFASTNITLEMTAMVKGVLEGIATILQGFEGLSRAVGLTALAKKFQSAKNAINKEVEELDKVLEVIEDDLVSLQDVAEGFDISKFGRAIGDAAKNLKDKAVPTYAAQLANLNKEFTAAQITLDKYNTTLAQLQIDKANKAFLEGKKTLEQYNKEIEKITGDSALGKLNKQFEAGAISVQEYTIAINKLDYTRLEQGVKNGTTSIMELNKAALETKETFDPQGSFLAGVSEYVQSAGTLSSNIASAINSTFGRLEDSLVEFTKTGKFAFRDFATAILEDLNRIIIRQLIVKRLAGAVTGSISTAQAPQGQAGGSGQLGAGDLGGFAKGGAFNRSGVNYFARGGVVNAATGFSFGGGKQGVMGEAGPEAILPLSRGSNGDLGVKSVPSNVNINIVNNVGDSEVSQQESTDSFGNKTIDILIQSKVKEGISNGSFDKTFKSSFGLNRKGL